MPGVKSTALLVTMVLALGSVLWILGSLLYLSNPSRSADTVTGRIQSVGHASVGSAVPLNVLHRLYLDQKLPIDDNNVADKAEEMPLNYRYKSQDYPPVMMRRITEQHRILVTGGAGFVGSHLVDRLMLMGHHVIVMDNLYTGSRHNIQHWIGHPNFEWLNHDVIDPLALEVDQIYHLACPASPPHYQKNPIKTIATSMYGTDNMLKLAQRNKARFLLTSTSGKMFIIDNEYM
jgi:UDP-glucuronate decarboxylase